MKTKPTQSVGKKAKTGGRGAASGSSEKKRAAKAKAPPRKGVLSRVRKEAPPPEPDVEVYGEAEPPPESFGQDRSRQKARFRELTWAQFDTLVQGMSREVGRGFKPDVVVGVAHGGVFVGGAVARSLGCEFFPVRISRRSRDKAPTDEPRMYGEMPAELKGRSVLIVDDVASSGDTLELALALAKKVGAKKVQTACLVAREGGYKPDWSAIETSDLVVFPWDYDLQHDPRFRTT